MNVAKFRWKEDSKDTGKHIGIIAEEAPKEILSADGKAVSYSEYLAFLLAAIKAQNEKITELESKNEGLKSEISGLRQLQDRVQVLEEGLK